MMYHIRFRQPDRRLIFFWSLLVFLFAALLYGCSSSIGHFRTADETDFYLVSERAVTGYRLDNGIPAETVSTAVEVIRKNFNPVIRQAEISDRYLMLSEDGWPDRSTEGVISIDFLDGTVAYRKTDHSAWTSAGSTVDCYLAGVAGSESFISVWTPELEETDHLKLDPMLMMDDFTASGDSFFITASDVMATTDKYGHSGFQNYLLEAKLTDSGQLEINRIRELAADPERQYTLDDLVVKGEGLYLVCVGWQNKITHERSFSGSVYRYDVQTGEEVFMPLEVPAPVNSFDIGNDWLAVAHDPVVSGRLGFSLFDYESGTGQFVDLGQLGVSGTETGITDIQRMDAETLLILTGTSVSGYDLKTRSLLFQLPLEESRGAPVHIWTAR